MFQQMNIPIFGIVENMSVFIPPDLPERQYPLFGVGGGKVLSEESSVPLLSQLPFEMNDLDGKDEGVPIVFQYPDSITAKAFHKLVTSVVDMVNKNTK